MKSILSDPAICLECKKLSSKRKICLFSLESLASFSIRTTFLYPLQFRRSATIAIYIVLYIKWRHKHHDWKVWFWQTRAIFDGQHRCQAINAILQVIALLHFRFLWSCMDPDLLVGASAKAVLLNWFMLNIQIANVIGGRCQAYVFLSSGVPLCFDAQTRLEISAKFVEMLWSSNICFIRKDIFFYNCRVEAPNNRMLIQQVLDDSFLRTFLAAIATGERTRLWYHGRGFICACTMSCLFFIMQQVLNLWVNSFLSCMCYSIGFNSCNRRCLRSWNTPV